MAVRGGIMVDTRIIDGALEAAHTFRSSLGNGPVEQGQVYGVTAVYFEQIADEMEMSLGNGEWIGSAAACYVAHGHALADSIRALAAIDLEVEPLVASQAQEVMRARETSDTIAAGLHQQKMMAVDLANCGAIEASTALQIGAAEHALQGIMGAEDKINSCTADHAHGMTGLRQDLDLLFAQQSTVVLPQDVGTLNIDPAALQSKAAALEGCAEDLKRQARRGGISGRVQATHGSSVFTAAFNSVLLQFEVRRICLLSNLIAEAKLSFGNLRMSGQLFEEGDCRAAKIVRRD